MSELDYGYEVTFAGDLDMDAVIEKVTAALKAEGFGILTEIDVAKTFDAKLGVDFRPYKILGACNPNLAHKAIGAEPFIGLMLPCNVVVQQLDDMISVSIVAPKAMFSVVDSEALREVMEDADARLQRAAGALAGS